MAFVQRCVVPPRPVELFADGEWHRAQLLAWQLSTRGARAWVRRITSVGSGLESPRWVGAGAVRPRDASGPPGIQRTDRHVDDGWAPGWAAKALMTYVHTGRETVMDAELTEEGNVEVIGCEATRGAKAERDSDGADGSEDEPLVVVIDWI